MQQAQPLLMRVHTESSASRRRSAAPQQDALRAGPHSGRGTCSTHSTGCRQPPARAHMAKNAKKRHVKQPNSGKKALRKAGTATWHTKTAQKPCDARQRSLQSSCWHVERMRAACSPWGTQWSIQVFLHRATCPGCQMLEISLAASAIQFTSILGSQLVILTDKYCANSSQSSARSVAVQLQWEFSYVFTIFPVFQANVPLMALENSKGGSSVTLCPSVPHPSSTPKQNSMAAQELGDSSGQ